MSSDINVQTFSGKVNISNNLLVGSGHLFVDTQNNLVGLRTSDPQAGLHVESNTYVRDDFRVGSGIVMNETLNPGRITAGSFVGDGSGLDNLNTDSGSWVNGTSSNVHLATTGDSVGIGVTTVDSGIKLQVNGVVKATGFTGIQESDVPTLSAYATTSQLSNGLNTKQDSGSYATTSQLSTGLNEKQDSGSYATTSQLSTGLNEKQDSGSYAALAGSTSQNFSVSTLTTTGDVGIGTTIPEAQLHIGPKDNDHIYLASSNNDYGWKIDTDDQGAGDVPFRIIKRTNDVDTTILTIKNQDGNVGIGTIDPETKLEVAGDIQIPSGSSLTTSITDAFTHDTDSMPHYGLKWREHSTSTGAHTMQLSGYHGFKFFTQSTERVTISGVGNVGIGVNPPLYKLDVDGDINFTGALKYQGSDFVSTPWNIHTSPDALSYTAGNIGIGGAASATNKLKVTGTIEATTGFSGTATNATNVTLAASSTAANHSVIFSSGTTGSQALKTDPGLVYNPSTNILTTNVSGSASSAGTITSQANSATITASASAGNSTIVQRHSSGYIYANYFNTTPNDIDTGITKVCVETGNDGFIRHGTQTSVRSFLGLGAYAYKGDSIYNIHDGWLRENGDNGFVRLYGNSRSMVFRTDGTTQYSSNGGYPFVWLYGGDGTGNRRMLINTSGQLWMSNYGWLHDKFALRGGDSAVDFYADRSYADDWFRAQGDCGIYWETHQGGWHMTDSTWIRAYNTKKLFVNNEIMSSSRIYASGYITSINMSSRYYNSAGNSGNATINRNISMFAAYMMRCSELQVQSDRRIKTDIVDVMIAPPLRCFVR